MSERPPDRMNENADEVAVLLGRAGARERPRAAAESAAFEALHAQWRSRVASQRRGRLTALTAASAAAAAALVGVYVWLQSPAPSAPAELATIEHVEGGDITWRDDRTQAQPLGELRALAEGQRLATGSASRVALRWHDGGSLRLDEESRLEFVSATAVRLTAGNVYFDSAVADGSSGAAPELAVQTPAGEVVHIGTQFMVSVASDEVVLSVREGQVRVTGDGFELVVAANQELDLRADGTREVTAIDGHGERWAWAADVAPQIALDGRTTFDVVAWAARETGRRVFYATPTAQMRARDDVLHGVDRRSPSGILTLLPHLTSFAYEIRDDTIVVSEP
jgi:ferric-dicitrate binding protein FerR (iron transport regulator)